MRYGEIWTRAEFLENKNRFFFLLFFIYIVVQYILPLRFPSGCAGE